MYSFCWIGFIRGEVGEERRDAVLEGVALVAGAHADRYHRDQRLVGQAVMQYQVAAQRGRAQGHDDIVECAAKLAPHTFSVFEGDRCVGKTSVSGDWVIPWRAWGLSDRKCRRVIGFVAVAAQPLAHHSPEPARHRLGNKICKCPDPAVLGRCGKLADAAQREADHLFGPADVFGRGHAQ